MTEYLLEAPFHIDDGELDGVTARDAFVLGAEFAMLYAALAKDAKEFAINIHRKNAERCVALCDSRKRNTRLVVRGEWVSLSIGARLTS